MYIGLLARDTESCHPHKHRPDGIDEIKEEHNFHADEQDGCSSCCSRQGFQCLIILMK